MAGPGQTPGRYNIIIQGAYETFDRQIPVDGFIQRLRDDAVPDEVSVVGLGDALNDGQLADELAHEMGQQANDLEYQSPTVQFVVSGSFHRQEKVYPNLTPFGDVENILPVLVHLVDGTHYYT